jgi:hypothetical protein
MVGIVLLTTKQKPPHECHAQTACGLSRRVIHFGAKERILDRKRFDLTEADESQPRFQKGALGQFTAQIVIVRALPDLR